MSDRCRVIQWVTGHVGSVGLRHFIENPTYDLVGLLVTNPEKVGRDAGDIAGTDTTGVIATDDVDAMIALDADCVFYTPMYAEVDVICRILSSGKNVVATGGYFYPTEVFADHGAKIEAACRAGGVSFHSGGIHPGYAGDVLPLTLARVMNRIDTIGVYEVVNVLTDAPLDHIAGMGFGKDRDAFLAEPTLLGMGVPFFAMSMHMIADGLGLTIEGIDVSLEAAVATRAIPHDLGAIEPGTVAAQHHEWRAIVDGTPRIVFHAMYWTGSADVLDPAWDFGATRYQTVIDGDPPTELILQGVGGGAHPGYDWTAMGAANAIPAVCAAPPGWVTNLDLGLVQPRGLVRR
jgi:2,4-diaminopentanoate dehydrogenase